MCTISWLKHEKGIDVFFNRDEGKKRSLAELPRVRQASDVKAIYPIDPDGGGTWCAVNEHGVTLALLNFYQGRTPKGRLNSRGSIIKGAASMKSVSQVKQFVESLELQKYAPFSLLIFSPESGEAGNTIPMMRWTGKQLEISEHESPLISSAFKYEDVRDRRLQTYAEFLSGNVSEDDHIAFHKSHIPSACAYSVCMHREDASTVSFSHVKIGSEKVAYQYYDGSPCGVETPVVVELQRSNNT